MDAAKLMQDGTAFAGKAVFHDQNGDFKLAHFFYMEASEAILKAIAQDKALDGAKGKALQYIERAETLQAILENEKSLQRSASQSQEDKGLEQIEFLLMQAISEDESGSSESALRSYTEIAELCIQKGRTAESKPVKEKLNKWANDVLARAEAIKRSKSGKQPGAQSNVIEATTSLSNNISKIRLGSVSPKNSRKREARKGQLAPQEIEALLHTSFVNKRKYLPWMDVDLNERFAYKITFSDPDGPLSLAPKQSSRFSGWVRPSDICQNPQMIYAVSSFSIKQTIVSDCSFVASLAISAAYERQFRQKLITTIIYPQDRDGNPIINPCGKYMVKLRFNGVARKVIIDDTLPMGKDGELLCSFSQNRDEFWVSLLEKAYMKVMGGYDFPGSNSNIDLHALTGWIPERASLKSPEVNHDVLFERLTAGLARGDVLITAATGPLSDLEASRAGLVPTHAYAVLDMKSVKGRKLLQLKNPWSHLRWKGNYSATDEDNWTPELEQILRYDRKKAEKNDNGVFWINWESLRHFYDVLYMNWNPRLFVYKYSYHSKWKSADGPIKDAYNIGDNPQYSLEVQSPDADPTVWLVLTRHITQRDDFAENKEFITLHIFKSDGRRVYYPDDKYLEGTKINSPHYLCKMTPPRGTSKFTVAVSQYEKTNTIFYSIKVYSSAKFLMGPVPEIYSSKKKITCKWTNQTAGGSRSGQTYEKNPKIPVEFIADNPVHILMKIEANRKFATGVELRSIDNNYAKNSGDYRWGFVAFTLRDVPPGRYHIIPSTFSQGQEGPFFLEVQASCAFRME